MSYRIPTTQELFNRFLAVLESQIGQDSPIADKAFLKVLSGAEAGQDIGLYKYAADRAQQNLALTATGEGLDRIGNDNTIPRKLAEAVILTATLNATTGTVIPAGREFVSDSNGLRYKTTEAATAAAGVATLTLRCTEKGADGNLDNDETLSISAQIAGAETQATVTATVTLGANEETDANYRPRILFAQRALTGGANAADHKIWGEAVTGVKTIYPYSGKPVDGGTDYPGDRTLYVEATTDIDSDGIAPESLILAVRTAINTDPDTGESRMPLGLTDDTLYIQSIIRTIINVNIIEFDCNEDSEDDCKNDVDEALTAYFLSLQPFIPAIDLILDKRNVITKVAISEIVQDVLKTYGASATDITFEVYDGEYFVEYDTYTLDDNEKTKFGEVSYE